MSSLQLLQIVPELLSAYTSLSAKGPGVTRMLPPVLTSDLGCTSLASWGEMNENGSDLRTAIYEAMRQRGTAAVFTAVTMTIGVATWAFSALKFQADMGILLAFMFLVNVLGAIFLLPAMAYWLKVGNKGEAA